MMKHRLFKFFGCFVLAIVSTSAFAQGVTTSSMNGKIKDINGEAIPGATVIAVHTPSGSTYGNVSDGTGYFRIPNMRIGGPYKVTISFVGYGNYTKDGIYLTLGQSLKLDVTLTEDVQQLSELLITADKSDIFDGNRTGAETVVGLEKINEIPTIGRAIGDFARFTPQARIEEGGDGFEISVAGMNNRYNAVYIDGAVSNDVFGLAGSGTNGGQTGVSPYPIDAIEQFNISIAPFDVRQSGFAGASINAVTRSGTNEIEGSAYYFFRNENLAGKTPSEEGLVDREKLPSFTAKTIGARVGGPIIKDKLFFFVNAEVQRDETPQPFDLNTYRGNASQNDLNSLVNNLNSAYGYDPGNFDNNTAFLNSEKIITKLDYNLDKTHKISFRHSYVKAENLEARRSDANNIQFVNGSELFISNTNSVAVELKSNFDNMSNHFTAGMTLVRDDRDPSAAPFPSLIIGDGNNTRITLGAEQYSTANLLNQDAITFSNNFELYKGKHTFLVGANVELYKAKNLFISSNYGNYDWSRETTFNGSNLADFIAGEEAEEYSRNYSQVDNITGDESGSGVTFNSALFGLYFQDEFQATDNLKLTMGLRFDYQTFDDTPVNDDFNTNTIPLLEADYDLQGAKTGDFIDPKIYIAPRVGFNWDVTGEQTTQIRGGLGLFTSRIPLVWPGGAFNNNGVNLGGVFVGDDSATPDNEGEPFNPDINTQTPTTLDPNNLQRGGSVDIFAADFKIPQVLKFNLAVDQKLPGGVIATVEFLYNKFYNNLRYQNVNIDLDPSNVTLATGGADNRTLYLGGFNDPSYGMVILASNIDKGYTYNASLSLSKSFDSGFNTSVSYSYGDAQNVFEGTSSQNSSQWRYRQTVSSRNSNLDVMRSQFAQAHRFLAQASYSKEYAKHFKSQLSLVYEARSGNPYSFIIGDANDMIRVGVSRTPELAYIPLNNNEINMPAADYAILDEFIEANDYLRENRGGYADRNMSRTPFEGMFDLRFLQDFYIENASGRRNTLQLSFDIINVGNLINKNWGKMYNREDVRTEYALYNFAGFEPDGTTPTYTANSYDENKAYYGNLDDSGLRSSRWQMQVGVRYIF